MTTYNVDFTQDITTSDATFRAWGLAISTALAAIGLVQTSDTGQINWSTVLKPSGSPVTQGYEIWRFNDALQSTAPVFIKFAYGSAGGQVPGIIISIGTGSNGAGTLTGLTTSGSTFQSINSAYVSPLYGFGDGSSFGIMTSTVASLGAAFAWSWGFFIERSRDADGTPNGDGLWWGGPLNSGGAGSGFMSFTNTTVSTTVAYLPIPVPARYTSYNQGTDLTVFPAMCCTPKPQGSSLLMLGCALSEFPRLSTQSVVVSGAAHTYLAITGTNGARSVEGSTNGVIGLMMRYE